MGSDKRLTSKSVLLDVLDFVEGEVELVEVLQLEQGFAGHLVQRVAGHIQAEEIPGKALMRAAAVGNSYIHDCIGPTDANTIF